jgi:hypothetical protein
MGERIRGYRGMMLHMDNNKVVLLLNNKKGVKK